MKRTILLTVLLLTTGTARAGFQFQTLAYPGVSDTLASGISDLGQIVGVYGDRQLFYNSFSLSTNGVYSQTSIPGAYLTYAYGINDSGVTVGQYEDGSSGSLYGYVQYSNGSYVTINPPGAVDQTFLAGINNLGQAVGAYLDGQGFPHPFVLNPDGTLTPIVVPGVPLLYPTGINDQGDIVGYYSSANVQLADFLLTPNGTFTSIEAPERGLGAPALQPLTT